jgi:hypothetical protein
MIGILWVARRDWICRLLRVKGVRLCLSGMVRVRAISVGRFVLLLKMLWKNLGDVAVLLNNLL